MTGADKDQDQKLISMVSEALEKDLDGLDPVIIRRLAVARTVAVEHGSKRFSARWFTAGGLASAAVAAAALLWFSPVISDRDRGSEDLEILVAGEHLDLYADLEFYQWLADHDAGN